MQPVRRAKRAAGLVLAALFLWLGLATLAAAHAALNGTEPIDGAVVAAAPERLVLTFNEPVSPLALNLIRPDGSALPLGRHAVRGNVVEIETPAGLSEGTHVLTWRVVSADGHPVGGAVVFSIGAPSAAPPPVIAPDDARVSALLWLTRLALYAGLFAGIGGAFAVAFLTPASRSGARLAMAALALGFAGTALSPGLQGLDALGAALPRYGDAAIWSAGMRTSYGRTVVVMLAALVLAAGALLARNKLPSRLLAVASLACGAGALALSGHASAAAPQWLMRSAVFLHAATIAIWAGALIPLGLALRAGAQDATSALRRFSASIPIAVALLAAAGIALAVVQVERPAALADTAYGRLLCVKLALLVILFALAALNRWRLTAPAAAGSAAGAGPARRRLVRSIMAETLLVAAILGVVAGWRFTPPPRALAIAAARPAVVHIHAARAMADVTVTPGRAGPVTVSATIMTGDFGPLDAREVTFVFSNPAAGIEGIERKAEKPGDGTWRADAVVLPLAGSWTVRVDILIDDFDLARIEGEIEIAP